MKEKEERNIKINKSLFNIYEAWMVEGSTSRFKVIHIKDFWNGPFMTH